MFGGCVVTPTPVERSFNNSLVEFIWLSCVYFLLFNFNFFFNFILFFFFFSSRRRHTRLVRDWSSDVCSSDLSDKCSETE